EDGIRGRTVTGVQTCALPIYALEQRNPERGRLPGARLASADQVAAGEDRTEHGHLHRRGGGVSPFGDSLAQLFGDWKISEACSGDVIAHRLLEEEKVSLYSTAPSRNTDESQGESAEIEEARKA